MTELDFSSVVVGVLAIERMLDVLRVLSWRVPPLIPASQGDPQDIE